MGSGASAAAPRDDDGRRATRRRCCPLLPRGGRADRQALDGRDRRRAPASTGRCASPRSPQAVPELSDRLLSERMKELEARGIVERRVLAGPPRPRRVRADRDGPRRSSRALARAQGLGARAGWPRTPLARGAGARPASRRESPLDTRDPDGRVRAWPTSPQTADDVKAHRRRARHPLHPLLVHRHPRPAEVVLDQRRRARRRLRGRDGLRRLLDHRLQRDRGVRHDRDAGPLDVRGAALAAGGGTASGACSATCSRPSATPYEGDPRHVLRRALERATAMGFDTFNVGPELEYFYFRDSKAHRGPRRGRLLRPHDARRRLGPAPRDRARPRAARHPRRVHPPRGRARPSTRSTCATPTR